jgi:hypothetical protein
VEWYIVQCGITLLQANQGVYVAPTDWTTANTTLHSMQSTVEDVVALEYIWQIDHKEYVRIHDIYGGNKSKP